MPRKRHTPEQIIRTLREAKIELAKGQTTVELVRKLWITEQTYYRGARNTADSDSTRRSARKRLRRRTRG